MCRFIIIVFLSLTSMLVAAAGGPNTYAVVCIQVIAPARNHITGEVREFSTPCDVPEGWERLPLEYHEEKQAKPEKKEQSAQKEQPTPPAKPSTVIELPKKFSHLRGRILLEVQSRGQAWYVNPKTGSRYFLGRPHDAFTVMRKQGLGVSNADFARLVGVVPAGHQKLLSKIPRLAHVSRAIFSCRWSAKVRHTILTLPTKRGIISVAPQTPLR